MGHERERDPQGKEHHSLGDTEGLRENNADQRGRKCLGRRITFIVPDIGYFNQN